MRLLGHVSRKYKEKEYHKHWIVIPNILVEKLNWKIGDHLKADAKDGKLIVKRHEKEAK